VQQHQHQQLAHLAKCPWTHLPASSLPTPSLAAASCRNQATITHLESYQLCKEYLDLVAAHPSHARMVKGHVHKLLRGWLSEFTDIRERIQRDASGGDLTLLRSLVGAGLVFVGSLHVCWCLVQGRL
jgi:hypothetical protein